jgi:hypothetical protein
MLHKPSLLDYMSANMACSSKSSLVFGTIATESQRLINETCSAFPSTYVGTTLINAPMTSTVGATVNEGALLRLLRSLGLDLRCLVVRGVDDLRRPWLDLPLHGVLLSQVAVQSAASAPPDYFASGFGAEMPDVPPHQSSTPFASTK